MTRHRQSQAKIGDRVRRHLRHKMRGFQNSPFAKGDPRRGRLLLLILVLTLVMPTILRAAAELPPSSQRLMVSRHAQHLADPTGTLSFVDVGSGELDAAFLPHHANAFAYGLNRDTNWIRFRLTDMLSETAAGSLTKDAVLYLDYASFDYLDVYFPLTPSTIPNAGLQLSGVPYVRQQGGWLQTTASSDQQFVFPTFTIPANVDPNAFIYLRVRSDYTRNFRLIIEDQNGFQQQQFAILAYLFFTTGVVAAVLFSNLMLFIQLRDPQYLLYVIYTATLFIYQNGIAGTFRVLDTEMSLWITATVVFWSHLAMFSALRFVKTFLRVPERAPHLEVFFRSFMALCIVGALLVVGGLRLQANILAYVVGTFAPILLVTSAAVIWSKGRKLQRMQTMPNTAGRVAPEAAAAGNTGGEFSTLTAGSDYIDKPVPQEPGTAWENYHVSRYYFAASFLVLVSVLTFAFRGIGLIPHSFLTSFAISGTGAAEAVLYSLALAERIRHLQLGERTLRRQQAQLSTMSFTDELTGLGNRRHLNSTVEHFKDTRSTIGDDHRISENNNEPVPAPLSVMYLDIDRFKAVNDTFGHAKGDRVLKRVADTIKSSIRSQDTAFRVGGEEFAVWLPNTVLQDAEAIAERIRKEFSEIEFVIDELSIRSTVSIGVAQLLPGETPDNCLIRADKALYAAKKGGRNAIHCSTSRNAS